MLIRLIDHFKDNPKRIDKLIAIKGLPHDWLFRDSPEGPELKKPWEPDVDKNIPMDIRHLCEPMYLIERFAPLNRDAKEVLSKRQIFGIRIDYNTEPSRQLWDDIERYIEESLPREVRIPVPVLCARDERSAFDTYRPRRNSRGSLELEPAPVPLVDLTQYAKKEVEVKEFVQDSPVPSEPTAETKQDSEFKCDQCTYHHASQRGVRMHAMKAHPKKVKAGV